jgi:hypothetical protein
LTTKGRIPYQQAQPGSRIARKGEAGAGLGDGYNPRLGLKARPHPFQEFLLKAWQRTFSPSFTTAFNKD